MTIAKQVSLNDHVAYRGRSQYDLQLRMPKKQGGKKDPICPAGSHQGRRARKIVIIVSPEKGEVVFVRFRTLEGSTRFLIDEERQSAVRQNRVPQLCSAVKINDN